MTIAGIRTHVPLPGSERQPAPGAQVIGPIDPNEHIEVTIYLRPRTAAGELAAQAAAMGAQPPRQRTYLTPDQFTALYGADLADMEKVVAFLRHHGLKVVSTSLPARRVTASGTAHAMESAFHAELKQYSSLHGPYRGCDGPVEIPIELRHIIEGVFGLDNREQASWPSGGETTPTSAQAAGFAQPEDIQYGEHAALRVATLTVALTLLVVLAALIVLLR